jgi:ADP-ribose pyrophosphatase
MDTPSNLDVDKLQYDLRKYPVRAHVGVGGLLIYQNKVLLIQRKYDPGANQWAIPGGHLKLGETCKAGAEREFEEETTIKVKTGDLAGIVDTIIYDESKKIKYHYVLINYYMIIMDERFSDDKPIPKLEAQSDAADIALVPIEKLPNYNITRSLRTLLTDLSLL